MVAKTQQTRKLIPDNYSDCFPEKQTGRHGGAVARVPGEGISEEPTFELSPK